VIDRRRIEGICSEDSYCNDLLVDVAVNGVGVAAWLYVNGQLTSNLCRFEWGGGGSFLLQRYPDLILIITIYIFEKSRVGGRVFLSGKIHTWAYQ